MHILMMIAGVVAAAAYYYYGFKRAGNAVGEVIDTAGKIRGKMRRKAFSKKVASSPLAAVEDPGTAAAILLVKIAEAKGPISVSMRDEITNIVSREIGMPDADEVVPFAEWVCSQVVNPGDIVRRFRSLWLDSLNTEQLAQLGEFAEHIAGFESKPAPEQLSIVQSLRQRLNIE